MEHVEWNLSLESNFFIQYEVQLSYPDLTRGGNGIGVFVNTYQDGFCAQGITDSFEIFQDTSDNITWQFETKKVSQSFFVFQLEPKYEKLVGRYAKTAQ